MAEDWDLFAIVRSCQSATNTATTPIPQITTSSSLVVTTSTVKEENYDAISFPNLVQPITNNEFQELHQLFTPFNPTTTTPSAPGINLSSPYFAEQERQQISDHLPIWPHFVPQAASTPRSHDQQQQQQNQLQQVHKQEFQVPQNNPPTVSLNTQPQTSKSRKRKSQQKKMVCHVTADNLSADLWAWRKYGQKPIKGSPYPRNYYRCSSSKGCMARKQVERSNTDPDMFIVTYTGDHSHPRPTHRNSLAGSTRSKTPATNPQLSPGSLSSFEATPFTSSSSPPETAEVEPDPEMETDVDDDGDIR